MSLTCFSATGNLGLPTSITDEAQQTTYRDQRIQDQIDAQTQHELRYAVALEQAQRYINHAYQSVHTHLPRIYSIDTSPTLRMDINIQSTIAIQYNI